MADRWALTHSGIRFRFEPGKDRRYSILDIAKSLANTNRFNGQTKYPYSVAQHSINVMRTLVSMKRDDYTVAAGLLHDAAEAYVGDLPFPLRPSVIGFSQIEDMIQGEIYDWMKVDIKKADMDLVDKIDKQMGFLELWELFPSRNGIVPPQIAVDSDLRTHMPTIEPMEPGSLEKTFRMLVEMCITRL